MLDRCSFALFLFIGGCEVGDSGEIAGKKNQPLCHSQFRGLERCLSNDYERLRNECAKEYARLQSCLDKDWKHIDDANGYIRARGSFNRMKRCRHGVMMYNPLDWYIGRGLEVYGEWGEKKVHVWNRIVKAGHVVVEVGAHVGSLTLPLADLVGATGRVVAIEPFYPSYATLAANIGLNSIQNVELKQAVVADRLGKVFMNRKSLAFGMNDFFNFGSMNFNNLRIYNTSDDVERPSAEWDEYPVMMLDQMSLARLDFIKVDAEAMELAVLEGGHRMIKKFKPVLFIEYRNPWEKETTMLDFLRKKLKYECVLLRIPVVNTENFWEHSEDIWGGSTKLVSFNLLCKHRWWEYPEMDDAVLELFDTAVDTDIEGLRTTPTADPFEAMALSGQDSFAFPTSPNAERPLADGTDELTLDELLGDAPQQPTQEASRPAAGAMKKPPPRQTQEAGRKQYDEMTLDELLDMEPDPFMDKSRAAGPSNVKSQAPVKAPPKAASANQKDSVHQSKPPPRQAAATKKKQSEQKQAAKRYEDMTLDELLDDKALGGPGFGDEDVSIDELLGQSQPSTASAKTKTEDLTLDELLDGFGESSDVSLDELLSGSSSGGGKQASKSSKDLTLDELLGTEDQGNEKWKDMTLDELLGPDPAAADSADMALLDELLGDKVEDKRYEDMSLDELLALDDPAPSPPREGKQSSQPRQQQQPPKRKATSAGADASRTAGVKAAKPGVKQPPAAKQSGAATTPQKKSSGGSASRGAHVKVTYNDDLTLDEL